MMPAPQPMIATTVGTRNTAPPICANSAPEISPTMPSARPGGDRRIERLRAAHAVVRHRAGDEQDGAEVRGAVGQRVQHLQRDEHAERRIERHHPPAHHRGAGAGDDQLRRAEAAHHGRRQREQHHLGEDADRPQRADPRGRQPLRLPVQRAERVERRVRPVRAADGDEK